MEDDAPKKEVNPTDEEEKRFLMDFSMHKVAKYFRLLGYDTICSKSVPQSSLVSLASTSGRTLITCSKALVRQAEAHNRHVDKMAGCAGPSRVVAYDSDGESVYSSGSDVAGRVNALFVEQWRSRNFNSMMVDLIAKNHLRFCQERVFSLCVTCNEYLRPTAKENVRDRVEPKIFVMYEEFTECAVCRKVFWGFDGNGGQFKSFRTLELLRSLCLSAGALNTENDFPLASLLSFRSFPRRVKTTILSYLAVEDLRVFVEVFPVLEELITDVVNYHEQGVPVKPFREIKNCK
ncbi:hypothetical protein AGDE_05889 [Angomonas deanei]|nr:hypothetical protein AGDE_05889 [Angomonas deanei]|eukprot:EPY38043.1 hypothetical protein AGDE_05889 [Angomonas deanei]